MSICEEFKKVIVIAIFFGVTKTCFPQTYQAEYKCIFSSFNKLDNLKDTSLESRQPSEVLPLSLVLKYTIVCNNKFLEVIGEVDSSLSPKNISVKFLNFKAIFDLTNNLVYFPEEQIIKKILVYELQNKGSFKEDCFASSLRGFDSTIQITTCKKIPKNILPAIKLKNNTGGVKSITTPQLSITMLNIKKVHKTLDYTKLFLPYLKKEIPDLYIFF